MIYQLKQEQQLPISLEQAWEFFCDPNNLDKITPPDMKFQILSGADQRMHEGQIIHYNIQIAPGIWNQWLTEIKNVHPLESFVDEQRAGPYKLWHHKHSLEANENGVLMIDQIHYALPFGLLGDLVHKLYVRKKLQRIFDHRVSVLKEMFPE